MAKFYCLPILIFFISVSSVLCQRLPRMPLRVYYETLDPDSSSFIAEDLLPFFSNGLSFIADLHLVPWGKAQVQDDNTYKCENGPDECLLNTIEACAINVWPDFKSFIFVNCVQLLVNKGAYTKWEDCFTTSGMDQERIDECYGSGKGKEHELRYAAETKGLQPPLTLVPWVTVDGQPLYNDYRNYKTYICNAYKGPPTPPCNESSSSDVINKNTRTPAY